MQDPPAITPVHRIEAIYNEDDLANCSYFVTCRLKMYRAQIRLYQIRLLAVVLIVVALFCYRSWHCWRCWWKSEHGIFCLALTAVVAVVVALAPWRARRGLRKNARKMVRETCAEIIGKTTVIELREDAVHRRDMRGELICNYSSIGEIVETDETVYVFVGKDRALILPRDRIPGETLDAFIGELKRRTKSPTSNSPTLPA